MMWYDFCGNVVYNMLNLFFCIDVEKEMRCFCLWYLEVCLGNILMFYFFYDNEN